MPSPFPGMDPYLEDEKLWPTFQHQLIACLYSTLLPAQDDRYRAGVSDRKYIGERQSGSGLISEEHMEEYIEIRQRGDGRLITLVDVVSPFK